MDIWNRTIGVNTNENVSSYCGRTMVLQDWDITPNPIQEINRYDAKERLKKKWPIDKMNKIIVVNTVRENFPLEKTF